MIKYYYTYEQVKNLMQQYDKATNGNYQVYVIDGSLQDNYIITADGCKTAVIKELYLSCMSSGHTIRMYNKMPQKYQDVVDLLESGEEEKARNLFFR